MSAETGNTWFPSGRAYLVKTYRLFDAVAAVAALTVVFTEVNLKELPIGVAGFLTMRITIKNLLLLAAFSFLWQSIFKLFQLYDLAAIRSYKEEARRVLAACSLGSLCALVFPLASNSGAFSYRIVGYFWVIAIFTTLLIRLAVHALTPEWTPLGRQTRRLLILGSGPRALQLYHSIIGQQMAVYKVVGFVDSRSTQEMNEIVATQVVGQLDQLEEILTSRVIDEVLIALPIKSCYSQIQQAIGTCERIGIECKYLSDIFQVSHAKAQVESQTRFPFVSMKMVSDDYRLLVKRALDILGAMAALDLLSPLM
ncbi:MAG: hypothetical protein LH647_23570, partial [Leptolyngbyaceae cyanobacterium CAN_BIN12]|nr:hypothetical protein [Leptolyngbyaceae cyanobacterium CAN_BIN12]